MSIKKSILSASALALAVSVVVGGTFAYNNLSQGDASAVNVAEYGKGVDIKIVEQQRSNGDGSELEAFEQGKALYPIIGGAQDTKDRWGMPTTETATNFVDKIVTIENEGAADVYLRFFYAIPKALVNGTPDNFADDIIHVSLGNRFDPEGKSTYNEVTSWADTWDWPYPADSTYKDVIIDGKEYVFSTYTYETVLKAGETSDAPICGIYMDANIGYENGCYTYKGTPINYDFSQQYVLPVFAQAVSASLADTAADAFAIAGMPDNPWAESGLDVPQAAENETVLTAGGSVYLAEDIALESDITTIDTPSTINLNGYSITASRTASGAAASSVLNFAADATLTGDGVVENAIDYYINIGEYDKTNKVTTASADVVIEGGTYKGVLTAVNVVAGNLTITGGTFEVEDNTYGSRYLINCYGTNYANGTATVTITGGSFKNWDPSNSNGENPVGNFVPAGYSVITEPDGDDIWYTVVKN